MNERQLIRIRVADGEVRIASEPKLPLTQIGLNLFQNAESDATGPILARLALSEQEIVRKCLSGGILGLKTDK